MRNLQCTITDMRKKVFAEVAKLYPEFTPEKVAEAFLRGM